MRIKYHNYCINISSTRINILEGDSWAYVGDIFVSCHKTQIHCTISIRQDKFCQRQQLTCSPHLSYFNNDNFQNKPEVNLFIPSTIRKT